MNENPQMTSLAMSVFNTIYGWFVEHGYRPYITIVDMAAEGLVVPKVHAKDKQLIVNIDPAAVTHFLITELGLEFQGRFGGSVHRLYVPWDCFMLSSPDYTLPPIPMGVFFGFPRASTNTPAKPQPKKPTLTVIK